MLIRCTNEECSLFEKNKTSIGKVVFDKEKGELTLKNPEFCPECGKELSLAKQSGIPIMNVFDGLPDQDKRDILKERAKKAKDQDKERLHDINKQTLKRFGKNG